MEGYFYSLNARDHRPAQAGEARFEAVRCMGLLGVNIH
jgi:hypothetical protein